MTRSNQAAIVLAGGDGCRMQPLTRFITGRPVPKQFCALTEGRSLLEQTLERVSQLAPVEHTALVVNRAHRKFVDAIVTKDNCPLIVSQPCNRGTVAAILYGLRRLAHLGRDAIVTIFPSDHYFSDEKLLIDELNDAIATVEEMPACSVVLGIPPSSPDNSYGWIEPGDRAGRPSQRLFRVRRFWEKPDPIMAASLRSRGCLWNSFIIVARAPRLQAMIAESVSDVYVDFNAGFATMDDGEPVAVEDLYRRLRPVGFSEEVLSSCPPDLLVKQIEGLEWSDLGEPERVVQTLRMLGREPWWLRAYEYSVHREAPAATAGSAAAQSDRSPRV